MRPASFHTGLTEVGKGHLQDVGGPLAHETTGTPEACVGVGLRQEAGAAAALPLLWGELCPPGMAAAAMEDTAMG